MKRYVINCEFQTRLLVVGLCRPANAGVPINSTIFKRPMLESTRRMPNRSMLESKQKYYPQPASAGVWQWKRRSFFGFDPWGQFPGVWALLEQGKRLAESPSSFWSGESKYNASRNIIAWLWWAAHTKAPREARCRFGGVTLVLAVGRLLTFDGNFWPEIAGGRANEGECVFSFCRMWQLRYDDC